jgi:hypothetical protein
MSTIYLPQMFVPEGYPASVVLKVALVHATTHMPVIGFLGDLYGYACESSFTLDGNPAGIELPANASLAPDSLWRFTLEVGSQVEIFYVDLADGLSVPLVELLYGALSSS